LWVNRDGATTRAVFAVPSLSGVGHDIYVVEERGSEGRYAEKVGYDVDLANTPAVPAGPGTSSEYPASTFAGETVVAADVRTVRAYCDDGTRQVGIATGGTIDRPLCGGILVAFDRTHGTSYLGAWNRTPVTKLAGGATEQDLLSLAKSTWATPSDVPFQVALAGELRLPDGKPGRLLAMSTRGTALHAFDFAWVPAGGGPATTPKPSEPIGTPINHAFELSPIGHPPVLVVQSEGPVTFVPPQPILDRGKGYVVVRPPTSRTAVVTTDANGVAAGVQVVGVP
jgi:hypothetical protein